jgi:hypothetical protein
MVSDAAEVIKQSSTSVVNNESWTLLDYAAC